MDLISDLKEQVISYYDLLVATLPRIAMGIVVLIIFLLITASIRRKIIGLAKKKAQDPLLLQFLDSVLRIINVSLGILLFLYIVGLPGMAGSLLGAVSLSTVVLGFAFKDIGENFIAGVIMAFSRPFNVGDTIMTGSVEGSIVMMSLRHTHIKTFDGKDVYVPNAQLVKNPLYNYTIDGFLRKSFVIGIDYGADVDTARAILLDNIKSIPGVLTEAKGPRTHIKNLSSSAIDIEVHYWVDTFDSSFSGFDIYTDAINSSLRKLTEAGIHMPGDILAIKNYSEAGMLESSN